MTFLKEVAIGYAIKGGLLLGLLYGSYKAVQSHFFKDWNRQLKEAQEERLEQRTEGADEVKERDDKTLKNTPLRIEGESEKERRNRLDEVLMDVGADI